MMHAFEIKTGQGRLLQEHYESTDVEAKTAELEEQYADEEWYRIRHHECYHDEGKKCNKWQVVAEKGNMPDEEGV